MSRSSYPCCDERGASTDNLETYRYFNHCGLDAVSYIPDFRFYERIYRALRPGGVFVNADVVISAHSVARERSYRLWAAHLVSGGIDEQRAYEHFAEWAAEDTYFPLDDELAAMREAEFHAECIWRDCPNTLLVGRKK